MKVFISELFRKPFKTLSMYEGGPAGKSFFVKITRSTIITGASPPNISCKIVLIFDEKLPKGFLILGSTTRGAAHQRS